MDHDPYLDCEVNFARSCRKKLSKSTVRPKLFLFCACDWDAAVAFGRSRHTELDPVNCSTASLGRWILRILPKHARDMPMVHWILSIFPQYLSRNAHTPPATCPKPHPNHRDHQRHRFVRRHPSNLSRAGPLSWPSQPCANAIPLTNLFPWRIKMDQLQ